ncbi:hypothetical protein [Halosegnis longus]|uniref:hypothetical protein n=1 Tax=Halosegnis longus TaxID=2216012 RepID=UPI00129ED001|nr:hypothetical protein [Halosegnis longus]
MPSLQGIVEELQCMECGSMATETTSHPQSVPGGGQEVDIECMYCGRTGYLLKSGMWMEHDGFTRQPSNRVVGVAQRGMK